jgi:hypothetical protein
VCLPCSVMCERVRACSRVRVWACVVHRCVHSRANPRHAVRVLAGRLHSVLQLLPHRNTARGTYTLHPSHDMTRHHTS